MTTPSIGTEVADFFSGIEKDAVIAWDDFLGGIKYLSAEAKALAAWVEKEDPAIQSQVQTLITVGETAAAALVSHGGSALANIISTGVDLAEQTAANALQTATGNPVGSPASALLTAGIADLGAIFSNVATVGYTKAVAAIASAAGVSVPPEPAAAVG